MKLEEKPNRASAAFIGMLAEYLFFLVIMTIDLLTQGSLRPGIERAILFCPFLIGLAVGIYIRGEAVSGLIAALGGYAAIVVLFALLYFSYNFGGVR